MELVGTSMSAHHILVENNLPRVGLFYR